MKLLHLSGIAIEKTIQCATKNGASLFGMSDRIGQILPGFNADFCIIHGNPEKFI